MQFTAVYIKVPEGYIAFVEELPGANTQGDTLEEARDNLQDAVASILEAYRELAEKSLGGMAVTKEPFVLDRSCNGKIGYGTSNRMVACCCEIVAS